VVQDTKAYMYTKRRTDGIPNITISLPDHKQSLLMFVWQCVLNMKWRMRPIRCNKLWFINNLLAQHVSGIIMPIFRSTRPTLLHMVLSSRCAGWSLAKPGSRPCSHGLLPGLQRIQPAHLLLNTICSNVGLVLLKMGIMMPETCWANRLLINHNLLHLCLLDRASSW